MFEEMKELIAEGLNIDESRITKEIGRAHV